MRPSPRFLSFLLTSLLLLSTTPLLASEDPPTSLSATPPFAPACASSAESTEQEDNESYYSSEWDRLSSELAVAYNTFRGMPDGSWNGNTGCFARVNFGIPLSLFSNLINMQVGGSYGVYQWSGRGTSCSCEALESETQGFLTAGLFGTLPSCLDFNMGAVVDGMFNDNFGIFSLSPTLGQVRAQVAVGFCQGHEVGVWGTFATNTAIQSIQHIPVAYKAIDQINLLWRYRYHDCSEVMAWIGTPYTGGLALRNRRPGQLLAGFSIKTPLTDSIYLESYGSYMVGQGCNSLFESRNYAANICIALTYYPGGCKNKALPYLPVANNSNFLVDASLNY